MSKYERQCDQARKGFWIFFCCMAVVFILIAVADSATHVWNHTVGLGGRADTVFVQLYRDFSPDSSFTLLDVDSVYFEWTEEDSSYLYAWFRIHYEDADDGVYGWFWDECPIKWRSDGDSCYFALHMYFQEQIDTLVRRTWVDMAVTATDTFLAVDSLIDSTQISDSTALVWEFEAMYDNDTLSDGSNVIYGWTEVFRGAWPDTSSGSVTDTIYLTEADTTGDTTNTTQVLFDLSKVTGSPMNANAVVNIRIHAVNDSLLKNDSGMVFPPFWTQDTTNSSGRVIISLYPNSYFTNDSSYYAVTIKQKRYRNRLLRFDFRVPDEDTTVSFQNLTRW